MKNIFYLLIGLFCCNISNAQTDTTNWEYLLDVNYKTITETPKLIKLDKKAASNENALGAILNLAIRKGEIIVYQDKVCEKTYSVEQVNELLDTRYNDTIKELNVLTMEDTFIITKNIIPLSVKSLTTYELVQMWNYNDNTNQLEMTLKSVHVYFYQNKVDGEVKNYLFSFKVDDSPKKSRAEIMNDSNIIWAKEIRYSGVLSNQKLSEKLLSDEHLDNKVLIYDLERGKVLESFKFGEYTMDTIVTFDPETFEEVILLDVKYEFIKSRDKYLLVMQDIYFDKATNQLQVKLHAVSPTVIHHQIDDENTYSQHLFWIIYDDDFLKWLD